MAKGQEEKTENTESQQDSTESQEGSQTQDDTSGSQAQTTVPVGVVKDLREDKRQLVEEKLDLQRQVQELQPTKTVPESPLEKWVKENPECPPDGEVLLAQKRYDDAQVADRTKQVETQQQQTDYNAGIQDAVLNISDAQKGEGLGFTALQAMGQHLLTRGDQLDIFEAGKNAGKVAYERLQQRVLQAGGAGAEEVKKRLASRAQQDKQQKDKQQKEKGTKKTGESEEESEEKPEMRESTSRVSNYMFGE